MRVFVGVHTVIYCAGLEILVDVELHACIRE